VQHAQIVKVTKITRNISDLLTGVFNGKIFVEREAKKTNAFQKKQ
jgi:hypothetical protein